jgi:hypothetical protein
MIKRESFLKSIAILLSLNTQHPQQRVAAIHPFVSAQHYELTDAGTLA